MVAASPREAPPRRSLRRGDFERLRHGGRRVATRYFVVLVQRRGDAGNARLGITVTRKVGNAVRRNRIKRLVREWFRIAGRNWAGCDLNIIAKRDIPSRLSRDAVVADLEQLGSDASSGSG